MYIHVIVYVHNVCKLDRGNSYVVEIGLSLKVASTSRVWMHLFPETNKYKIPDKIRLVGILVNERINSLHDVIGDRAVSSGVHLP